jgi:hypothetical protein
MRRKAVLLALFALVVAAAVLAEGPASGQPRFNVTVYPAKMELTVAAGTGQPLKINVRNDSNEPQALKVYFMDYFIRPDNSFVFKEPGHYSYSCAKWLNTDSPSMVVQPGEVGVKPFGVNVPADAEPGGHYGVIFFEQTTLPGQPPAQVKASGRIGVVTLITVPGEIVREGVIKDVQVDSAWWWPTRKLPFLPVKKIRCRVVFENRGNVHLTIKGKLTFAPSFGWGTGTVNLGEITVLPHTTRYLDAYLGEKAPEPKTPDTSAPGQQPKEETPPAPFIGSYRVKAEVRYGPSLDVFDTTRTKDSGFDVYPLSLLVILLVLIALVLIAVKLFKIRKVRKESGEGPKGKAGEPDAGREGPDKEDGSDEEAEAGPEPGEAGDVKEVEEKTADEPEGGGEPAPASGDGE